MERSLPLCLALFAFIFLAESSRQRRKVRSHLASVAENDGGQSSGNRGTKLSLGEWEVDGGLYLLGIKNDDSFKISFKVKSIDDSKLVLDIHATSRFMGRDIPPGGFKNLVGRFTTVKVSLFKSKSGYLFVDFLSPSYLSDKILIPEGESKLMYYIVSGPLGGWYTSGNEFQQPSSASLALSEGSREVSSVNRGTKLSLGEWEVDGGLYLLGKKHDYTFKISFKVKSIDDSKLVMDIHGTSRFMETEVPPGGFKNLVGRFTTVKVSLFKSKSGYLFVDFISPYTDKILIPEGESKLMYYIETGYFGGGRWYTSGNEFQQPSSAPLALSEGSRVKSSS